MPSLVMTILGQDHPGVVESVAEVVAQHQANWLESRMAHLAGQFAGIVHVEVDADHAERLVQALRDMDRLGLTVIVQKDMAPCELTKIESLRMELLGGDRPGIVREVTHVLAQRNVNVEEFQTECTAAPMSGERVFKATAQLRLPDGLTIEQLQRDLEEIAHDLMVDIRLDIN